MTARAAAALLVSGLLLAGCGTVIDGTKVEKDLTKRFANSGVTLKSVKCPTGMTPKKGDTFKCKIAAGDGSGLDVELMEDNAKGHVTYMTRIINHDQLESGAADTVSKSTGAKNVEVSCPDIIEQRKGVQSKCTARSGADTLDITITQTNDNGAYSVDRAS